jgi:hypothetical protein
MLAIAFAMPALANVTVTVDEGVANDEIAEVTLAIDGGSVVRGLAITVTITNGDIDALDDVTEVMAGFNAYIDYYYSNPDFLGTLPDETGLPGTGAHALADPDAAGVLATLPATEFSISLGALDNTGAQGGIGAGGQLCKINVGPLDADAEVCVVVDALRGGIVGDNLGTITVDDCATIAKAIPPTCVKDTAAFYGAWLGTSNPTPPAPLPPTWDKPDCWCFRWQCRGDINGIKVGLYWVQLNDLNLFKENYLKKLTGADILKPGNNPVLGVSGGICAELDHTAVGLYRVQLNDLNVFKTYYLKKETGAPPIIIPCPADNYNFWKLPDGTQDPIWP